MTMPTASIAEHEDYLIVSGDINFVTIMDVWRASLPLLSDKISLRFDFSQVTSVNSAGLSLLLEWQRYAKQHHQSVSFYHLPSQLISLAAVAGIKDIL
jgi:ABC-type transporter Mla MlaB component